MVKSVCDGRIMRPDRLHIGMIGANFNAFPFGSGVLVRRF